LLPVGVPVALSIAMSTALAAIVVAKLPVPVPVISPVKVIVCSAAQFESLLKILNGICEIICLEVTPPLTEAKYSDVVKVSPDGNSPMSIVKIGVAPPVESTPPPLAPSTAVTVPTFAVQPLSLVISLPNNFLME